MNPGQIYFDIKFVPIQMGCYWLYCKLTPSTVTRHPLIILILVGEKHNILGQGQTSIDCGHGQTPNTPAPSIYPLQSQHPLGHGETPLGCKLASFKIKGGRLLKSNIFIIKTSLTSNYGLTFPIVPNVRSTDSIPINM